MTKFKYLVIEVQPDELNEKLNSLGYEGWILCNIIPLQKWLSIPVPGQPPFKLSYQLVFKMEFVETKNSN